MIIETAKSIIDLGLKDLGYNYVVIDDCWSLKSRDENGKLVADPEKFPHGIKWLAEQVHKMGLKLGIYSCAGLLTCAGYPGSYDHEFDDANTFASWDIDFLKYDYCYRSTFVPGHILYKRMGLALANCGRDIVFSACSWGADDTKLWIKETGANIWRSTGDIIDSWVSIKGIAQSQLKVLEYNGQGCFNDMDMLIVGMNNTGRVGGIGCTNDEYFLHFALWCLLGSPIIIGCDVRNISKEALDILANKGLIRINQDSRLNQPFMLNWRIEKNNDLSINNSEHFKGYPVDAPVIARFLDDGKIAIGFFNFTDGDTHTFMSHFNLEDIGISNSVGKTLLMRDVESGEEIKILGGQIGFSLKPHCARVFICEVVDV